ncbi:MAG: cold-shock protein CspA [Myxococcaceae bacterium]|nr:cold-shock protein CspA [Myxococcaceae bacterium]
MSNQPLPMPSGEADRDQEYVADVSFDSLGLSPEVRKAIAERGYTHPTPVQAKAFAPVMEGKDVIVRSKTGTGKTAAFGIPLLEKIAMGERKIKALIMCPTRELAMQVAAELTELAKYRDVHVTAIYGGASMKVQEDALEEGSAIIVGTPGRVYDHIQRKNMKLSDCAFAVLDEADEMLNQGFYEEVTRILDCLPKTRQVLLFSATVPEDIQRLISKYTTDAQTLLLSGDVFTVDHIQHVKYDVSEAYPKPRNLIYMLEMEEPDNAIVFCNTRSDTELVTAVLNRNGFDAEMLNGDLPQKERERVMAMVKRGEVAFMVATDLAARGIDISDLGHVINYTLPEDPAVYLHRVGRTGRIGKKGVALNLVSGREFSQFSTLEKKYGIVFEKREMPSPELAVTMWTDRHVKELKEAASGTIYEGFLGLASELKKRPDADELIALMLKSFFKELRKEKLQHGGGEAPAPAPHKFEKLRPHEKRYATGKDERPPRGRGGESRPFRERGGRPEAKTEPERSELRAVQRPAEAPEAPAASDAPTPAEASAPIVRTSPPRKPSGGKKLTDRELFEALQRGETPPIADPTTDEHPAVAENEVRATRSSHSSSSSEVRATREPRESRPSREDRERRPRRERSKSEVAPPAPGQVRLWLNLGTLDGLDPATLTQAMEAAGAPTGKLQRADVLRSFSYLFVAEEDVAGFEATAGKKQGEKSIKIERAKK